MYTLWSSYQHILTKSPGSITDGWRQWFLNEMYHKVLHFCKLFVFVLLSELEHCFCEWSVKFSAVIGNNAATVMKLMKRLNTTDSINLLCFKVVCVCLAKMQAATQEVHPPFGGHFVQSHVCEFVIYQCQTQPKCLEDAFLSIPGNKFLVNNNSSC